MRDAFRSLRPALWVCAAIAAIIVLSVYEPTSCASGCHESARGEYHCDGQDDY